jgi:hypothetical protein
MISFLRPVAPTASTNCWLSQALISPGRWITGTSGSIPYRTGYRGILIDRLWQGSEVSSIVLTGMGQEAQKKNHGEVNFEIRCSPHSF